MRQPLFVTTDLAYPGVLGDDASGLDATGGAALGGSLAVAGAGGTTPTATLGAKSGQTGYLLSLTTPGGSFAAAIAVDGEFVTADDVLAPTGTVKGKTLAFAPSGTGAPTSGTHAQGELVMDTSGAIFACTASGTPGTWHQISVT